MIPNFENNLNKIEELSKVKLLENNFDMNDLTETDRYFSLNALTPTNIPPNLTNNGAYIEVMKASDTVILQRWTEYEVGTVWERQKVNNSWKNWKKIAGPIDYILVKLSSNTQVTTSTGWNREIIPLNAKESDKGNTFSFENNKVKIKRDCTVRVNANGMVAHPANKYGNISVKLNNDPFMEGYSVHPDTQWHTIGLSSKIINVKKNDVLSLNYGSGEANVALSFAGDCTYLMVEEVL